MTSKFDALMALSRTQTEEQQYAVDTARIQRERSQQLLKKQREEKEKRDRENADRLRAQHFAEEKRQKEREAAREKEREAKALELQRREEEQRDALRYGPKKAKPASDKWPASSSQTRTRDEVRKKRLPDGDDEGTTMGDVLTREEKRERKLQADLKRQFNAPKRSSSSMSGGYGKSGRRLPGGAYDITTKSTGSSDSSNMSVRNRISAMPNTLTKLYTVKRDTRTIAEIVADREAARAQKTLEGDQALGFGDFFSTKKKPKITPASTPPVTKTVVSKPETSAMPSPAHTKPAPYKSATPKSAVPKSVSKNAASSSSSSAIRPKKRPRSPSHSRSLSPPRQNSKRRRSYDSDEDRGRAPPPADDFRSEIWKLFGKNRQSYVEQDVYSDDEDMEAPAGHVMAEEMRSTRMASKEDKQAQLEERRHEEEKRRKRKEREMRGK